LNERQLCVLLSVQRGTDVFTNPQGEFVLAEGDQLFVLAEQPPRHLERLARI
jgi:Trk K+ transport system NAD-binding subunit